MQACCLQQQQQRQGAKACPASRSPARAAGRAGFGLVGADRRMGSIGVQVYMHVNPVARDEPSFHRANVRRDRAYSEFLLQANT